MKKSVKPAIAQIEHVSCRRLLNSIHEAVVILDTDLKIHYLNESGEKILQVKGKTVLGKKIEGTLKLFSEVSKQVEPWNLQEALTTRAVQPERSGLQIQLPNETKIPVAFTSSAIRTDDNNIIGVMIAIRDLRRERELIRLRSEFVSITSHQLRTPASAVKWYIEALIDNRRGNQLNDWQQDKLHQAYQSNERMIHLINDLLNVSRLDSGRFELRPKPVCIQAIIDEVKSELIHFASAHNVELDNNIPTETPVVVADADKIREVIMNLLTNAIKYSKPGHRTVTISASQQAPLVEFSVHDQGIGIPEKDIKHLFEKFYRADNAIESQTEGSGLGLYIAREIVRMHGGDITVTSQEGKGTTVTFTLPIDQSKS
ncbi:MAG: two-component sensor histidine kinase [uncultured bacterium]|nr:MAG: two-component sensor histidine kinase [uncultured bacterium]